MVRSTLSRRAFLALLSAVSYLGLGACSFSGRRGVNGADAGSGSGQSGPSNQSSSHPADEATQRSETWFFFDTVCTIGGLLTQEALDAIKQSCEFFEQTLSRTIETSDISRINAAQGEPVEVETTTAELISRSLAYSEASGGLFDISIGAVSRLWDFHEGVVPSKDELAEAVQHVDWHNIFVEGNTVQLLDPSAALDVGGIAKGFIADYLVNELKSYGISSAYINLGGNVRVCGGKTSGDPWGVGIQDPFAERGEAVIARVEAVDGAVVTSGLYERQFEKDGKRYWHILDPRTGYPVESEFVSATISSDTAIDGDGFTKPLFMLSEADALAFLADHPSLQALLVRMNGSVVTTPGSSFSIY